MESIPNRRAIIDRRQLGSALEELVWDGDPHSPAVRAQVLELLRESLDTGQAEIRRRFEAGEAGLKTARSISFLVDQILLSLYEFTLAHVYPLSNPTAGEHLAVVAVGGCGRGEMAPHSDVDLLFLLPYKQTPWGEQMVEYLLYMLWDLGLKVGHATRSVDDCVRLSRADITIRTALLEARLLFGDKPLYGEFRRRYQSEVVADTGPDFTEAKLAERKARHLRLGDSRYLVEPNIKDGKGGLRDLHSLYWIAKYVYRVDRVADLVAAGLLTAAELKRFAKAEEFLWTVRCHLHYRADRAEERLTFDAQPDLGRLLRFADRAGAKGVERFMKRYYLVAKEVGDLTRVFCAQLEEQHKRKKFFRLPRLGQRRRVVDGFVIEGGRIDVEHAKVFAEDPVRLLRLFRLAQQREVDIHPRALKLITRKLALIDNELRHDPEANRLFLETLISHHDPETALRRLNEAGVLGRFVPDFGRVVAQMQHDMYHVYTVDEHSIRAIGMLARIEAGELAEDHPVSHDIIHKVMSREVLYLAVLLHDIAKGRGGNHSELGAEIVLKLAPRFGLSADDSETVAWLVRHHLVMSNTAFRRDILDPKTVEDFVAVVESPERLRLLVVLTVADIRAVGPGRWNGWKGQLLRELYFRAEEALSGGMAADQAVARVAAAKAALRDSLSDWDDAAAEAHFARTYDSYWLTADSETQERHARLMRAASESGAELSIDSRIDEFQAITEVTVFAADHPGLFARVAGAMAVCGANIVRAAINITADGMALDTFWVQDADGSPVTRRERLERTIEKTLSGEIRLHQALAEKTSLPSRTEVFEVAPRVVVDNKASNVHTVVEIRARDRRGLLHDVTRGLSDLGLTIASSRVATYGERAVDVFYVKDVFGLKVTQKAKLEKIRKRLLEAIEEPPALRAEAAARAKEMEAAAGS